ncbi:DUF5667 domain-containing protein [Chloroflexota bacterium]
MKKIKIIDNILDECLERVLIKGETVEQCLAGYPEQATELEPLLQTALLAKKASSIKPRLEFREKARYQFRAALHEMEIKRERRSFSFNWQPRWATVAVTVLVLILASGGTVAAAGNSMPDEPLYQVKLATEKARLTLTPSALGKAELYVKLIDKRVNEIVKMAEKGRPEQVERTAGRLNGHLMVMAHLTASQVEVSPEGEAGIFMAPAPMMPMKETPEAEVRGIPRAASEKAPGPPGQVGHGRSGAGEVGDEGEEGKFDKRAKLRRIVARYADDHPAVLRQALQNAPESVKTALRRAIAVSDAGYEHALKSLE